MKNISWPLFKKVNLTIALFYHCNLYCSYCFQNNEREKVKKELDVKKVNVFLNKLFFPILNKKRQNPFFEISIYGGELSIKSLEWNKNLLLNLLPKIEVNYEYTYITNFAAQDVSYYIDLAKFAKEINLNFIYQLSYHSHYWEKLGKNKKEGMKIFINKIYDLLNSDTPFHASFFYSKDELVELMGDEFYKLEDYISYLDLNHIEYEDYYQRNKKFFRPVFCKGDIYLLKPDGFLKFKCQNKKKLFYLIKSSDFKDFIYCDKRCPCDSYEVEQFKTLDKTRL